MRLLQLVLGSSGNMSQTKSKGNGNHVTFGFLLPARTVHIFKISPRYND